MPDTAYMMPQPVKHPAARETASVNQGPVIKDSQSIMALNAPVPRENINIPSNKTEELRTRAINCFNSGDFKCSADTFSELAVKDTSALLWLGFSLYKLGDLDRAAQHLEEGLKYSEDFSARKVLSFIYYKRNDLSGSLNNADKGLSLKKDAELLSLQEKITREIKAEGNFIKETTLHFTVFYDGYGHRDMGRKAINILEEAYNHIGRDLNYFPLNAVTVIIYTEKDFYDITRKPLWTGGIYDGKIRIPIRGIKAQETALRRVLFHEYAHALVHSLTDNCPLWINEGLAEYFSNDNTDEIGQVIPLEDLERSFPEGSISTAYKESHSAVKYLIGRYGIFRIKELLVELSKVKDINTAFQSIYYQGYKEFISKWGRN